MHPEVSVALEQLGTAERRVMQALFTHRHTAAETAELIGKSEGNVVVTFSKAVAALRQIQRDLAHRPGGSAALAQFLKDATASMNSEARR